MGVERHLWTRCPSKLTPWYLTRWNKKPLIRSCHQRTNEVNESESPRVNQLGIQYLSEDLHKKVFPKNSTKSYLKHPQNELVELAKKHLKDNDLLGKKTTIMDPITIDHFPELIGKDINEHFYKIGKNISEPYDKLAEEFFSNDNLPEKPLKWVFQAGWTRYEPGKDPQRVDYPGEDALVFDVEVLYRVSKYPVLATCASQNAWYGWVSPFLVNYGKKGVPESPEHLIRFNTRDRNKLLVGYNVSYDRARILDEYNMVQSRAFFLDGMALHVAVSGICSQQRPMWNMHKKNKSQMSENDLQTDEELDREEILNSEITRELSDDPWLNKGSPNSLANVADFHFGLKLDKADRDHFGEEDPQIIIDNFDQLMTYCSKDVDATFTVTKKLYPEFKEKCPHPVSFAALKLMGNLVLPTTRKWDSYIESAENIYQKNRDSVGEILKNRALSLVQYIEEDDLSLKPDFENDPWLRQLNWKEKEKRLKKNKEPCAKQAYLTGYPEWFRELFKSPAKGSSKREMNLTVRSRITPILLKLKWEGYPLLWVDSAGWCFKVPYDEKIFQDLESKNYVRPKLKEEEHEFFMEECRDGTTICEIYKVPHPDGTARRSTSIMSKSYLKYFEDGTMTSEYPYAQDILKLNSTASYWTGSRNRIMDQFVVYSDSANVNFWNSKRESKEHKEMAMILPILCTMGTITRRATENTWLTASNTKTSRIGSELKAMIEAPKGYCFVGADVDSEELWIASIIGDSSFGLHGGSALGWMTLEGDKNEKTDLHSKTAEILGISRDEAKVFNYGRIYGAGVKFATRLLQKYNSELSNEEAETIAKDLYSKTKGTMTRSKVLNRRIYHGGSESVIFNALEAIANEEQPRTPVLGAAITDALMAKNLNKNSYLTSRINWTIQSSGVDYLHLLITSMEYLTQRYQVNARLSITVHDEIRYLVAEKDKYKAALLLQISNLWTRAMFSESLGIKEVPLTCAFFSEVDIDTILRKSALSDTVTPSHPISIPRGECLTITQLLKKVNNGTFLNAKKRIMNLTGIPYKKPPNSNPSLDRHLPLQERAAKTNMQIATDERDWRKATQQYSKVIERMTEIPSSQSHTASEKKRRPTNKKSITSIKKNTRSRSTEIDDIDISGRGNELLAKEITSSYHETTRQNSKIDTNKKVNVKPDRRLLFDRNQHDDGQSNSYLYYDSQQYYDMMADNKFDRQEFHRGNNGDKGSTIGEPRSFSEKVTSNLSYDPGPQRSSYSQPPFQRRNVRPSVTVDPPFRRRHHPITL